MMDVLDRYTVFLEVFKDGSIRASRRSGGQGEAPPGITPLQRKVIDFFSRRLDEDAIQEREELVILGCTLYDILIKEGVRTKINEWRIDAAKNKQRLRLHIRFDEQQSDLANYPWEYLVDPDTNLFLSTELDMVLSRMEEPAGDRPTITAEESPLRILVAVSKPGDLDRVSSKEDLDAVNKFADEIRKLGEKVKVDVISQPTRATLQDALKSKPHVFHFIGHGRYVKNKGEIALIDPDSKIEKADWVDDYTLVTRFNQADASPRLVFLEMCQGAESKADKSTILGFTGFAPSLLRNGIPAVVAMKYEISNNDATQFSKKFYEALSSYETIGAAVQKGRDTIGSFNSFRNRVVGTPILYMISLDGQLTQPPPPPPPGTLQPGGLGGAQGQASGSPPGPSGGVQAALPGDVFSTGRAAQPGAGPARFISGWTGVSVATGLPVSNLNQAIIQAGTEALSRLNADKSTRLKLYPRLTQLQKELTGLKTDEMAAHVELKFRAETDLTFEAVLEDIYLKFCMVQLLAAGPDHLEEIVLAGLGELPGFSLDKLSRLTIYHWLSDTFQPLVGNSLGDLCDELNNLSEIENRQPYEKILESMYVRALQWKESAV